MRALHAVDAFLPVTANWIYPQIVRVPGVAGRVVCRSTANLDAFPLPERPWLSPPPWRAGAGLPRLVNTIAGRLGRRDFVAAARARRWRPQLLHAHFGQQGWETLALKRSLGTPLITSFYGYDAWALPRSQPYWLKNYGELFAAGDIFLVEGSAMRQRLAEIGCPLEKVRVHRIGVDLDRFPFSPRNFSAGLRIIMVGRFVEKKGLVDGLGACARARARGVDLAVTVVGDALPSDPEGAGIKRELQALAQGSELKGRVRFTGFVTQAQTHALLAEHNVMLCPSRMSASGDAEGGSPVILTEAMAAGLLCVGSVHCDIPEVILEGRTGFLCPPGDLAALAAILGKIGGADAALGEVMRAGRAHVEENFSLATQLARLGEIYRETVQPNGDVAA